MPETFEDKIKTYNENSPNHLQNWKKIRALVNFSKTVESFPEWEALEFIIRYFFKGFLWLSQEMLLNDILNHYKIDYTQWAVKNAWVKMQMINGFKCKRNSKQLEFPFLDLDKKIIEGREKLALYSKLERHKLLHI